MSTGSFPSLDQVIVRASVDDAGFEPPVADRFRKLARDAHRALDESHVSREGRRTWIIPGRIEVLGKHVDYAGGRSLLCTVERGIVMVAVPRTDRQVVLRDARRREAAIIELDESPYPSTQAPLPWAVYPKTVVRRLQQNFGADLVGADIAIASNLPPAAGVSSSSALVVGVTLVISAISDLGERERWRTSLTRRTDLAGYIGALENGFDFGTLKGERGVGTLGGAQDQTAILCCAPGKLDVFSWAPVRFERDVSWPSDFTFVIGVSGVVAAKTGAVRERYNRVARTAHHLVHAWNARGGMARTLADVFAEASGNSADLGVPEPLRVMAREVGTEEFSARHLEARLDQFYAETFEHVPQAADALHANDLSRFGEIVAASQRGAEIALENQIAETIQLVNMARDLGAVAASAFGAGFGGSVWAMVSDAELERFTSRWRDRYVKLFPKVTHRVQFIPTKPSAPVFEVIGDG